MIAHSHEWEHTILEVAKAPFPQTLLHTEKLHFAMDKKEFIPVIAEKKHSSLRD